MAIKTFTSGEVLTASDTNTYLNNGGLVYVTSVNVGTAVSSVPVTNAFNSTYDSYEIIYSNGTCSNVSDLRFSSPQSTGTNYFSQGLQQTNGSGTLTGLGYPTLTYWVVGVSTPNGFGVRMTVHNPFVARYSTFNAQMSGDFSSFTSGGVNNTNNSLTGLVFTPQTGTLTGGTITVYGYRKG